MKKCLSLVAMILTLCMVFPCTVVPASGEEEASHAHAYVLVTTAYQQGWLPLPDTDDQTYDYPLQQQSQDGTVMENVIHVTSTGFSVTSANCSSQDCVHQGEVTIDNMEERILGNAVYCLPHELCLQLFTWDQILQISAAQQQ